MRESKPYKTQYVNLVRLPLTLIVNLPALLSHNLGNDSWIIFPVYQSKNSFNVSLMQGTLKAYHKAQAKMLSLRK